MKDVNMRVGRGMWKLKSITPLFYKPKTALKNKA